MTFHFLHVTVNIEKTFSATDQMWRPSHTHTPLWKALSILCNGPNVTLFIDREAGEIIRLVASVRLFACLSVCPSSVVWTVWPIGPRSLCVCVCNQLLFRQVVPSRSITLLIIRTYNFIHEKCGKNILTGFWLVSRPQCFVWRHVWSIAILRLSWVW